MSRVYFQKSAAHIAWIKENCKGMGQVMAHASFCKHFDIEISLMQFKSILYNYKIKLGTKNLCGLPTVPDGELNVKQTHIKNNGKWQTIGGFLQIRQLRGAAKNKIKAMNEKENDLFESIGYNE